MLMNIFSRIAVLAKMFFQLLLSNPNNYSTMR